MLRNRKARALTRHRNTTITLSQCDKHGTEVRRDGRGRRALCKEGPRPLAPALPTPVEAAMLARDVMTRDVAWVTPEAPVLDVAELLVARRVSAVPVLDNGELVGIVSAV